MFKAITDHDTIVHLLIVTIDYYSRVNPKIIGYDALIAHIEKHAGFMCLADTIADQNLESIIRPWFDKE